MQVGISKRTLRQLKEDALIGALEPRTDRRLGSKAYERQTVQGDHADGFFHWLYWHMAEPLADTNVEKRHVWDPLADEGNPHTDEILPHVPQGNFDMGLEGLHNLPKRHLAPGKMEELYELYLSCSAGGFASKSTFRATFQQRWRGVLGFRDIGQHARCTTCTKISKMRALAQTADLKAQLKSAHEQHVTGVQLDRAVSARLERLARNSTSERNGPPELVATDSSVLDLKIDGMDQAKFRLPRNLALSKEFEKRWRPQMHIVAVIAAGVSEHYYVLPPQLAQDSNMTLTLLSHALDNIVEDLKRHGRAMPMNLCIGADNTARENRNQWLNKWSAYLITSGLFRSVSINFFQVGHTHAAIDQKFSIIATALVQQSVLEVPEDIWGIKTTATLLVSLFLAHD